MTHEEARDLIPFYALGILSDTEAQAVEQYLAQSADLRAELHHYTQVTDALLLLTPTLSPPNLQAQLSQKLKAGQPTRPLLKMPRTTRWAIGMAAAVLLLVGLWAFVVRDDTPSPASTPTRTVQQQIDNVLNNPNSMVFAVSPQADFSGDGQFVVSPDADYGVLQLSGMAVLPPEQDYQLWFVRNENERFDAGVFDASVAENVVYLIELPADFASYAAAGVTIEPSGGSPSPTGAIVLLAPLAVDN